MEPITAPKRVVLIHEEQLLFDQIDFELTERKSHEDTLAMLAAAKRLTLSLLQRGAIPAIRVKYFSEPELNTGRGNKSHKEVFESNGTRGDDILEHPHFLKFLKYFIGGPDLPVETIEGFCEIIKKDGGYVTGGTLDMLWPYVRSEIRKKNLDRLHAPEEFFKLAIEVGVGIHAISIRQQAMKVRS